MGRCWFLVARLCILALLVATKGFVGGSFGGFWVARFCGLLDFPVG